MNKYTIPCTEEQTRKALELGAPIEFEMEYPVNLDTFERSPYPDIKMGKDGEPILIAPTAEQMIGWLRDKYIRVYVKPYTDCNNIKRYKGIIHTVAERLVGDSISYKEATLKALDAALDYLIENKK